MKMHDIEISGYRAQLSSEIGRIIEPPKPPRAKIVNLNAVEFDGSIVADNAISRPIDTGCHHVHLVARGCKPLAQSMDRIDGTAIANSW